jgi:hypothetical protein
MGSRCHYPFSDRVGVRAHLLSIRASRSARIPKGQRMPTTFSRSKHAGNCIGMGGRRTLCAALSALRNSGRPKQQTHLGGVE